MTDMFRCGDDETLMAFMYDECPPGVRETVAVHLAWCARCAEEIASMGATRAALASWRMPEQTPGVQVDTSLMARDERASPRTVVSSAHWWHEPLPAWAQMAAAAVIFAGGLTLGAAGGGSAGTSGTSASAVTPVSPSAVAPVTATAAVVSPGDLAAVESQLRAEMAQLRVRVSSVQAAVPSAASVRGSGRASDRVSGRASEDAGTEAVLRQVRAMIAESERRQQSEIALRTTKMAEQVDTQRRVDLVQIQRRMGDLQELTGAAVRDQGQMVNYLYKVSQQR